MKKPKGLKLLCLMFVLGFMILTTVKSGIFDAHEVLLHWYLETHDRTSASPYKLSVGRKLLGDIATLRADLREVQVQKQTHGGTSKEVQEATRAYIQSYNDYQKLWKKWNDHS